MNAEQRQVAANLWTKPTELLSVTRPDALPVTQPTVSKHWELYVRDPAIFCCSNYHLCILYGTM